MGSMPRILTGRLGLTQGVVLSEPRHAASCECLFVISPLVCGGLAAIKMATGWVSGKLSSVGIVTDLIFLCAFSWRIHIWPASVSDEAHLIQSYIIQRTTD